jgi:hypothetical protein
VVTAASLQGGSVPSFFGRVAGMVVAPWREWETVAHEPTTAGDIYIGYVAPLTAIGAIAPFLAHTVIGVDAGPTHVRAGIPAGVVAVLIRYALSFLAVALLSRVAAMLAGNVERIVGLRIVAYSLTAAWLAAALEVVPALALVALALSLYSVFILFTGLRAVAQLTEGWALLGAVALSALAFGLTLLAQPIVSFSTGLIGIGSPVAGPRDRAYIAGAATSLVAIVIARSDSDDRGRMVDAVGSIGGMGVDFVRDIIDSGGNKSDASLERVAAELAKIAAGGKQFQPVDPAVFLRFLPPTVAGMPRVSATSTYDSPIFGLKGSVARARYEGGDAHVEVEIGDMAEFFGVARVFTWVDPALSKTTGTAHEQSGRREGRYFQERFDSRDGSGKFGLMVADRFAVGARGSGITLATLHDTVVPIADQVSVWAIR